MRGEEQPQVRPLPGLGTLTEAQLSGTECVWGGESLTGSSLVVDLGTQRHTDGHSFWFPRACVHCHVEEGSKRRPRRLEAPDQP